MIALSSFVKRVACSLIHISLLDAATSVTSLAQRSSNGKRSLPTAKVTVERCLVGSTSLIVRVGV
jgi:hypothetical protein